MEELTPEELRVHLARIEAIAKVGSWRWDVVTQTVWVSDGMLRIMGISVGPFLFMLACGGKARG